MKKCPYCGTEYPDEASICAVDHARLESDGRKTKSDFETFPNEKRNSDTTYRERYAYWRKADTMAHNDTPFWSFIKGVCMAMLTAVVTKREGLRPFKDAFKILCIAAVVYYALWIFEILWTAFFLEPVKMHKDQARTIESLNKQLKAASDKKAIANESGMPHA